MHYYKFNVADWAKDTGHLTLEEEAVYFRLINYYYDTEKPIPLETHSVLRRLRLGSHSETVTIVLQEFFSETPGGWVHSKCEKLIGEYQQRVARNRANGAKGGRKGSQNETQKEPTGLDVGTQKEPTGLDVGTQKEPTLVNQEPLTTNQEPITKDLLVPDSPKPEKHSAEDLSCAQWIYDRILMLNPGHKKPNLEKWANTIRLMRERDKRTHREICELFKWANDDQFWQTNILGPDKLRKQWDKLTLARNRNGKVNSGTGGGGVEAATQRSAAAFKAKFESGGVDLGEDDQHLRGEMDQGAWGNSESNVVDGDFEVIPDRD